MLGTIENNSKMFFAYNNGLTITADDVVVKNGLLHSITNIQVVNGGQTSNNCFMKKVKKFRSPRHFFTGQDKYNK